MERGTKANRILVEKPLGKYQLKDHERDESMILKWIIQRWGVIMELDKSNELCCS
jgi:hypothetical protein